MDDIDRRLLVLLRGNARATFAELGRAVGLSPASAHERVRRLEESGAILGYHAAVDPAALGLGVSALVSVYLSDTGRSDEVTEALRSCPQIEDCWFVAGDEAFVVRLRVADVDGLEASLGQLWGTPGIARTRTTVVLSTRWESRVPEPGGAAQPT